MAPPEVVAATPEATPREQPSGESAGGDLDEAGPAERSPGPGRAAVPGGGSRPRRRPRHRHRGRRRLAGRRRRCGRERHPGAARDSRPRRVCRRGRDRPQPRALRGVHLRIGSDLRRAAAVGRPRRVTLVSADDGRSARRRAGAVADRRHQGGCPPGGLRVALVPGRGPVRERGGDRGLRRDRAASLRPGVGRRPGQDRPRFQHHHRRPTLIEATSGSIEPELVQSIVVDAEVVRELVDDREPDFLGEVVGIGEVVLEREPEEGDLVRRRDPIGAPLRPRDAFVQPVEGVVRAEVVVAPLGRRGIVLDDDRDLVEGGGERHRDGSQGTLDEPLEADVAGGGRGGRCGPRVGV